ncbi:SCO4848 family membrane protein [Clavibacter tessellarius]|uniref:SCO4848 family membrane protein n=1 Tax=Clavibacter tessellarius TaxID=31965 RepID=UPI0039EA8B53
MITLLAVLLLVNGVWNVVVWPQFLKRVARDPRARAADGSRTPFFTVHLVLVSVSLLLAALSLVAAAAAFLS